MENAPLIGYAVMGKGDKAIRKIKIDYISGKNEVVWEDLEHPRIMELRKQEGKPDIPTKKELEVFHKGKAEMENFKKERLERLNKPKEDIIKDKDLKK